MLNQQQRDEQLWQMAKARAGFKWSFAAYIVVNAFLVGIWFFTHETNDYFWPKWPMLGWGVGIAFQYFHAYHGSSYANAQTEFEKLKREEEKKNL